VRRAHYLRGGSAAAHFPLLRRRLHLDDAAAIGSHRIEIGSGGRPTPGYIHIDTDTLAPHVEYFASGDSLPFADGWADEIVAVHVLEHVHPSKLIPTLEEWRRVIKPGGLLRIHVPDSRALMERYLTSSLGERWALNGAILGMYASPSASQPGDLLRPADHQVLFDSELLQSVLVDVGFTEVRDVSSSISDVHTEGWRELLPQISVIVEARVDSGAN
jgi:SAM-dependent methyltransferase